LSTARSFIEHYSLPTFVFLAYLFMYIPIIVLVLFSFNTGRTHVFEGVSLQWYKELFRSVEVFEAIKNSVIVACSAVVFSITMAVLFVFYGADTFLKKLLFLFYGGLAVPEVVLSVGLLSILSLFSVPLGITTLVAAHTIIGLSYATPILYSRYITIDPRVMEASMDLGATRGQTFVKVILPVLYPALITSALLVFILSFDDFILSFFCAGASTVTLPMYVFSVVKTGATPMVNALSTLILSVSSLLILILVSLRVRVKFF
jgi:spermidine/putrescine transport system permease protein